MTLRQPSRRRITLLVCLGLLLVLATGWMAWRHPATLTALAIGRRTVGRPLANEAVSLTSACRAARLSFPPPRPRVVVHKAERILAFYSGSGLLKEYPIGLGSEPTGPKQSEGDGCTPVGDFYVCTRIRNSRWHRFLGLSYPTPADAQRGLKERAISEEEHRAILQAHRTRQKPPWKTALGGEIGIHGGGSGRDWTAGCIALDNEASAELFDCLPLGAPVRVE